MTAPQQQQPDIAILLMAAGAGRRTGLSTPKQWVIVGGKPILQWSLDVALAHPRIAKVILVLSAEDQAAHAFDHDKLLIVVGGAERHHSVAAGLAAVGDAPYVMVHDVARMGLRADHLDALAAWLDAHPDAAGVCPALPIADSLAQHHDGIFGATVDRDSVLRVQTPQTFRTAALKQAHQLWTGSHASDDAQMVRAAGGHVGWILGDEALHKITTADDLSAAQRQFGQVRTATGMGFDVHRLVAGRPLWIGGIEIAHPMGLLGHSDADVALHALCDAIFGALADGDIGTHFPPSDARWRDARSDAFLRFAGDRVAARGGVIQSLDLTIMCEAPKIGPHRAAMVARIADILQLAPERVSVKATTTERLGFTGREEGIAAQAVVTLTLPA